MPMSWGPSIVCMCTPHTVEKERSERSTHAPTIGSLCCRTGVGAPAESTLLDSLLPAAAAVRLTAALSLIVLGAIIVSFA
jgi:hypothetical protein